jgi:plastocyanin
LAVLGALVLLLAACNSSGSASEEPVSQAPSSAAPASQPPASQPAASEAAPSEAGTARCELTPDASPSATVTISGTNFGDEVTITAGQAVAFTNEDPLPHTVTEGTAGQAAADACVDAPVGVGGTVVVTFNEAGEYDITCKIHATMQTVIHVQ